MLAWANVGPAKKKEAAGNIQQWGPMVTESILTDRGKKFARLRNICVIIAFAVPIGFAATMAIFGK